MDKKEVKKRLKQKIEKTKKKILSYENMSGPITPDVSIGRVSRMDAINNKSIVESALQNAREKLHLLEYALKHIDDDDFGLCKRCGQKIPPGRILVHPESALCVRCAV
ncbi:MAG: TraR/DksA family transcriptional regulator [Bacteroidetes bacterium]|jgi:DnaK suppressor protein|nr:TraR/DksA family transcriptional regulator [Bacteroidota bacterium]